MKDDHQIYKELSVEARQENDDRYRFLFERSPLGIFVYDTRLRVTECNARCPAIMKTSKDRLIGFDLAGLKERKVIPLLRLALEGKEGEFEGLYHTTLTDADLWLRACAVPLFDATGRLVGGMAMVEDITERKQMQDALQQSEERLRLTLEAVDDGAWDLNVPTGHAVFSRTWYKMLGYAPHELPGNYDTWKNLVHPDDRDRAEKAIHEHFRKGAGYAVEIRMRTKWGGYRWVLSRGRVVERDHRGYPIRMVGTHSDITSRKHAEALLEIQRDMALALGETSSMQEALGRLLQSTLRIEGIDSGGVYLVDAANGELQLVSHAGLSASFVDRVSCYGPETPQAQFAMQGEPTYWPNVRRVLGTRDLMAEEGLTSLAVIPVKSQGQVVALLSLASRTQSEVPESTMRALETIAAQLGGIVSRIGMEERLKMKRKHLLEANAALKVLLRQREVDRTDLEEALLANVKNLVLPYAEKLVNTRLTPEQALFVEIIQAHLREVTSPLLRTFSRQAAHLTPMEIRVADLIRNGRTTKEIANILGTSEKSVLFHRQNVRRKLGLKHRKVNLRSHLASLP